jgi:hypothetical protein
MNESYQYTGSNDSLISMVQPKKLIEHFGGDISEIRNWADLSSKDELITSIKAFEKEGLTDYVTILKESLNQK